MNAPCSLPCVLAALAAALMTQPARAEGNRLLPFWGQPYPTGYAWVDAGAVQPRFAPCGPEEGARPARRLHGSQPSCEVVLHARD